MSIYETLNKHWTAHLQSVPEVLHTRKLVSKVRIGKNTCGSIRVILNFRPWIFVPIKFVKQSFICRYFQYSRSYAREYFSSLKYKLLQLSCRCSKGGVCVPVNRPEKTDMCSVYLPPRFYESTALLKWILNQYPSTYFCPPSGYFIYFQFSVLRRHSVLSNPLLFSGYSSVLFYVCFLVSRSISKPYSVKLHRLSSPGSAGRDIHF